MRFSWLAIASAAALPLFTAACSSSNAGPSCTTFEPPSGTDLQNPKVSFSADVMPVFQASCAFSGCHGEKNIPRQQFLGNPSSTGLPPGTADVYMGILGVKSTDDPAMNFITAGDPAQSFLLHKMDGDQCSLSSQCAGGDCGSSMPYQNPVLDESTRLVVRRWIAQGAQNN